MNTQERLLGYSGEFSTPVIEAVADSVERQSEYSSYNEFLNSVGIDSLEKVPILDVKPSDCDPSKALVIHLPMANPIDANQLYSIGTVASMYPDRRIIAAGNPSGISYGYNTLSHRQRSAVSRGDFKPAVENLVRYMVEYGIDEIDQVGESYGADLVVATANYDEFELGSMVMIEPASIKKRSPLELAQDFQSSEPALQEYVDANDSSNLIEARGDSISAINYLLALGRLSNIAVGRGIAKGTFKESLEQVLENEYSTQANIAWGTESELSDDSITLGIVDGLGRKFGKDRVKGLRLKGQKHALANDRALQSAIIAHFIGLQQ